MSYTNTVVCMCMWCFFAASACWDRRNCLRWPSQLSWTKRNWRQRHGLKIWTVPCGVMKLQIEIYNKRSLSVCWDLSGISLYIIYMYIHVHIYKYIYIYIISPTIWGYLWMSPLVYMLFENGQQTLSLFFAQEIFEFTYDLIISYFSHADGVLIGSKSHVWTNHDTPNWRIWRVKLVT